MVPFKTEHVHALESLVVFELSFVVEAVKVSRQESNGIYELKEMP